MSDAGPGAPPPEASPSVAGRAATASGERTHPATPLVKLWLIVVAFAWFVVSDVLQGQGLRRFDDLRTLFTGSWLFAALALGLVVGLAAGWWGWWTTTFHVTDDEFRIENAGAFTESKRIAFSRIQGVDINQPFAARLLGLAELVIDVGGGDATKLAFLSRRRAGELRGYLMARAHGVGASVADPAAASSAWSDLAAGDRVLVRLNPGELVLGALLSLELLFLLAAMAIPFGVGVATGEPLLIGGGLVPIALGLWGFLAKRVVGQFNYTLAHTRSGLRITRGLTTLASQTVPVRRVQAIQVSQPVLWRLIGRYRVDLTVLGGLEVDADGDVKTSTLLLPIGTPAQVAVALGAVWPGLRLDRVVFTPSPARARWLEPLAHGWNGFGFDEHVLVARRGWFTRREFIVPHARLQSMELAQGPVDRRTTIATVSLHTSNALGGGVVPHVDAATARALVFDEMARAKAARADELLGSPDYRQGPGGLGLAP